MFYPSYAKILFTLSLGGLAQLGERFAGSEEVVGSIPIVSTIHLPLFKKSLPFSAVSFLTFDHCANKEI